MLKSLNRQHKPRDTPTCCNQQPATKQFTSSMRIMIRADHAMHDVAQTHIREFDTNEVQLVP